MPSHRMRDNPLTPFDSEHLSTGGVRASNRRGDVDTGEGGLRKSKGDEGRGKVEHFYRD